MNLWQQHQKRVPTEKNLLHLHFDAGIPSELKQQAIAFTKWLRKNYTVPITLHVYFRNTYRIRLKNGTMAYGSFRWYPQRPPYIQIAAKPEPEMLKNNSDSENTETILSSLVHELTHYYQWLDDLKQTSAASEWQANHYRYQILDQWQDAIEKSELNQSKQINISIVK